MDSILEKETSHNKTESWNRLDKTVKLQKLAAFAEKYGRDHALSAKDVLTLRTFFQESLEKNKLQRTKDVVYDKEAREIKAVPALYYNTTSRHFTLRITDTKRVSTLKSLTPLRRPSLETVFTNTILSAASASDKTCDTSGSAEDPSLFVQTNSFDHFSLGKSPPPEDTEAEHEPKLTR